MMNMTLFKMEWRNSYKLLIIFALILSMYTATMITMYDPSLGSALEEFAKAMPKMMAIVGMNGPATTLIQFMVTYLYGFIMIAFPFLFATIITLRLLAKRLDNGSMVYLLTSGSTRYKVWFTQFLVLISNLAVLLVYTTILGIICSHIMFPQALDIMAYVRLNAGLFILHSALASICFLTSCLCNEYKNAALWGAGIPIICILLQMLANMKGNLEVLRNLTILTLFDTQHLVTNQASGWLALGGLACIACFCFGASCVLFCRKDLSI